MARAKKKVESDFTLKRKEANVVNLNASLGAGRFSLLQGQENSWRARIAAGTAVETIEHPGYWIHEAARGEVAPMDLVEAFCEDGSWEASYRVMFVSRTDMKLSRRWYIEHDPGSSESVSQEFEVAWISPVTKFAVRRIDDHTVVKDGFWPESEAHLFLRNHLRTLA